MAFELRLEAKPVNSIAIDERMAELGVELFRDKECEGVTCKQTLILPVEKEKETGVQKEGDTGGTKSIRGGE
jgi:hypothetical protein